MAAPLTASVKMRRHPARRKASSCSLHILGIRTDSRIADLSHATLLPHEAVAQRVDKTLRRHAKLIDKLGDTSTRPLQGYPPQEYPCSPTARLSDTFPINTVLHTRAPWLLALRSARTGPATVVSAWCLVHTYGQLMTAGPHGAGRPPGSPGDTGRHYTRSWPRWVRVSSMPSLGVAGDGNFSYRVHDSIPSERGWVTRRYVSFSGRRSAFFMNSIICDYILELKHPSGLFLCVRI